MNYLSELSPYLQALLAALFTTLLGAFGALIVLFGKKTNDMFSVVAESFAAGIMLAASVFSLLLPAIEQSEEGWGRYAFILDIRVFFKKCFQGLTKPLEMR